MSGGKFSTVEAEESRSAKVQLERRIWVTIGLHAVEKTNRQNGCGAVCSEDMSVYEEYDSVWAVNLF